MTFQGQGDFQGNIAILFYMADKNMAHRSTHPRSALFVTNSYWLNLGRTDPFYLPVLDSFLSKSPAQVSSNNCMCLLRQHSFNSSNTIRTS